MEHDLAYAADHPVQRQLESIMATTKPRMSKEEFARRGESIYERELRQALEPKHNGEVVAIDILTGAYEVDADEIAATDRLAARVPTAQTWMRKVGSRHSRHFGAAHRTVRT